MARGIWPFCFLVLLALSPSAHAWPARVVDVSDGDTVIVEPAEGGDRIRVRLHGIDAPERKQPYGEAARGYLYALLLYKDVDVEATDTDRYGRTVAIIHLPDGTMAQQRLVETGHAWVWEKYCRRYKPYKHLCFDWAEIQREVADNRRGLWADLDALVKPVAPWKWRKGER